MRAQQSIKTRAISAKYTEIESLYRQRQTYLNNLAALRQQSTKFEEPFLPDVATRIANEETSLKKIEDRLRWMGMPINPSDSLESYSSVSEALQTLGDAQEIIEWVKTNYPQQFRQKRNLFDSSEHNLNSRLTGKWNGTWRSKSDPMESGKVIMALCQIDDELVGSGAFTNSIFSKAYLHGSVQDDSLEINLFTEGSPLECAAVASIKEGNEATTVRGTYAVSGWDRGAFEAVLERSTVAGKLTMTTKEMNWNDFPVKRESLLKDIDAPSETSTSPINIFISYSHKDRRLLEGLLTHLALLQRQKVINTWHDGKIEPGTEWDSQIENYLNTAQVILLLVSSDFLASDFCYSKEMARAIERHEAGEARVIPVILRQVDWKTASFARLQALPTEAKPITEWTNRDAAWTNVARGIRRAAENLAGH